MPPRLARLLAAVVAIALVAGAFALRGTLSDDDDTTSSGPGRSGDDGEGYRVLCDEDLGEAACAAVAEATGADVDVMTGGEVLAAYTADGAAPDWDLWLTLDPLPGVLDTARTEFEKGPVTRTIAAVASGPLALLTRADDLPDGCDDVATWDCLTEPVNPAIAVPSDDTALGIVAVAAGATGLHGNTDFDINDYRGTAEAAALDSLLNDSPSAAGSTTADQTQALLRPGATSAAVTIDGLATAVAGTVQGQGRDLVVRDLAPEVVVGVVAVGLGDAGDDALAALREALTDQTVRAALADGGWTGDPTRTSGLPKPDLVYALQEELG
ncbi:MAG TPA: hypothetical protein VF228_24165 [Iamia sp.]